MVIVLPENKQRGEFSSTVFAVPHAPGGYESDNDCFSTTRSLPLDYKNPARQLAL